MPLDVVFSVENENWDEKLPGVEIIAARAAEAAIERLAVPDDHLELSIVLADDAFLRDLNLRYGNKDAATNVLSFSQDNVTPGGIRLLGDIAISIDTVMKEAEQQEKTFEHHLTHMVVHGTLHLLGEDHEEKTEAEAMEQLEREILATLSVPDPYAEIRSAGLDPSRKQEIGA
jgi:probable rRNA maturation factor